MGGCASKNKIRDADGDEGPIGIHSFSTEVQLGKGGYGVVHACEKLTGPDKGTMYALITSLLNLGGFLSDSAGGVMTSFLSIGTPGYGNYWKLTLICDLLMLAPLALVHYIPINDAETLRCRQDTIHRETQITPQ